MLRLAHLSDVHLAPLPRPGLGDVSVKRALGYINWHRNRKRMHLRPALDELIDDLSRQSPNHIAVTGDLVNIGLPREYLAARRWLESLGRPSEVSVVPGNHDAYVRLKGDPGFGRWADFMRPLGPGSDVAPASHRFPYLRRIGDVVLIGLSSARPTPPFVAAGRLGRRQRADFARLLGELGREGVCRVVLIHHPPLPGQADRRRGLGDAGELAEILAREGAELVLHGHNHTQSLAWGEGPGRPVPVVGVPSASIGWPDHKPLARYNLFTIAARKGAAPEIEMIGRGLTPGDAGVRELERIRF